MKGAIFSNREAVITFTQRLQPVTTTKPTPEEGMGKETRGTMEKPLEPRQEASPEQAKVQLPTCELLYCAHRPFPNNTGLKHL
jgi:hypothetical protein